MKNILLKSVILFSLFTSFSYAQLTVNWANKIKCDTGGDDFTAAITGDANGNIISVGSFQGTVDADPSSNTFYMASSGGYDMYMVKYDTAGAMLWAKTMGGATNDEPYDVILDAAGNIYLTGFCSARTDFDGGGDTNFVTPIGTSNATGIFLAKYDANGDLIWAKMMSGTVNGWGKKMKLDSNGDLILVGNFAGTVDFDPSAGTTNVVAASTNFSDVFITKYTPSGALVWAKKIGGSVYDEVDALILDSNDNFYISGYMNQTVDFDPGAGTYNLIMPINSQAGYVAKYDNQGNFIWAFLKDREVYDLAIDASGKLRFSTNSSTTSATVYIYQYTLAGVYESAFLPLTNAGGEKLVIAADSSIYVGGPFENQSLPGRQQIFLRKLSKTGVTIYEKWFGGNGGFYDDELHALYVSPSGKVFIGGFFQKTVDFDTSPTTTAGIVSHVATSSFVAAYKPNGDYSWASAIEDNKIGYTYKSINAQHTDALGNVYLGGSFYGAIGFDPYTENSFYKGPPFAISNSFICKYGPNSQVKWAFTLFQQFNGNQIFDITTDNNQNVYITGSFKYKVDFDPGADTLFLSSTPANVSDIFIAKYDSSGNFLWAKQIGSTDVEEGRKIYISHNKIYLTGTFIGTVDFDPSAAISNLTSASTKSFFASYDLNGNYLFAKLFAGTYESIKVDNAGNIILSGAVSSGSVDFDFGSGSAIPQGMYNGSGFIAKYDSLTNYLWAAGIAGNAKCQLDSAQNIYVSGSTPSKNAGFNSSNNAFTAVPTNNNSNSYQYFLAKYSPAGILGWVKATSYSATNMGDLGIDFALDKSANIYVVGQFKDTVDFDFNAGTNILIPFSVTNPDAFIASYTANGDLNWIKTKQVFASQFFKTISIVNDALYATITTSEGMNIDYNAGGTFLIGESTYLTKYTLSCLNAPQIISVTPASRCGAGTVTLSVSANSGTPNWYSTAGSSTVLFSGTSFTTPSLSATKTYYVTVPSGACTAGRTPVTATINTIPTVTTGGLYYRCDPGTGTINALASAGVINWYDAPTGGNLLHTGNSYSIPFTSVTTNFYLDATDNGCTTATRKVHTFQIIRTPILLSHVDGSGCANSQILLSASVDSGNVQWQTSNGTWLWSNPVYAVTISTTTTYYVVGINSGCSTAPVAVTATVVATPSISSTTPATTCDAGVLTLTAVPSPSNAVIKWYDQAIFGTSLYTGNNFTTPLLNNTTTYYAEVSRNGCTNSTRSAVQATINPLPNVSVTSAGSTISAALSGASYQWLNCSNNLSISGATSQNYTATANGNYAVKVTQNGCSDTSSCIAITSVGIADLTNLTELVLYPNPTTRQISIQCPLSLLGESYCITNALGETILAGKFDALRTYVDMEVAPGIYFIKLSKSQISLGKIVRM
ncbi:MAG: T9SS type A sorting domain-containing protein [Bacteroidetes bacterium]|nr:T9SS type A sorting domain-containing protein [Bacteroidota bacterium]